MRWGIFLQFAASCALACTASASEPTRIAVASFDFVDTSGEPVDQGSAHQRRLVDLKAAIATKLSETGQMEAFELICSTDACSGSVPGIPSLSIFALQSGASHLLIGEVKKMSTLVGQIKFAIISLGTKTALCDRYLTYRGDSDEAWRRAAIFAARDAANNCFER